MKTSNEARQSKSSTLPPDDSGSAPLGFGSFEEAFRRLFYRHLPSSTATSDISVTVPHSAWQSSLLVFNFS